MGALSKTIDDVGDVAGLAQTSNQKIIKAVKDAEKQCCVFVSLQLDIYYVQVSDRRGKIALETVQQTVRKIGPGSEYVITRSVFNSMKDGETNAVKGKTSNQQVDELLDQAISESATDIHVHVSDITLIEFRIHGVMVQRSELSAIQGNAIIKVMFASYAKNQFGGEPALDAQFYYESAINGHAEKFLVRLSMVETVTGMTCKCRIRNPAQVLSLESAGYSSHQLTVLKELMARGQGLLVFTGAVNSGKSSTLTALLADIPLSYSVLEISDTVEVQLPNVRHVELPSAGDNLEKKIAAVQKSSVRQDSDYLVIGEMRDKLTAGNAEKMALQGCVVLSTGHSSDAISFYLRMVSDADFGMSKNTVLSPQFLIAIVNQALAATLCGYCSTELPGENSVAISQFDTAGELTRFFREGLGADSQKIRYRHDTGCDRCNFTGFDGRTVVAEITPFDREVRNFLRTEQLDEVSDYIRKQGHPTKHEHGLSKVLDGRVDPLYLERKIGPFTQENCKRWQSHRKIYEKTG